MELDDKTAMDYIKKNLAEEFIEPEKPTLIPKIIKGKKSGK
ncbi:MAG: hypothetical protein ACHQYQ_11515 [Bacteriovoracales bacterium]